MANPRLGVGGSRVPISWCHSFSLSLGCGELGVTQQASVLGSSFFGPVLHLFPLGNCLPPFLCSARSYSRTPCWGLAPGWRLGLRTLGREAFPRQIPRGQEERLKTELKPLAEDLAKRCLSQEGDLRGRTAGGRMSSPGGGSGSWGLGVSPSSETHQTAGAGPIMQEGHGPTSSQEPDLVTPQGPNAGEGPCRSPEGARASSHSSCWAWHHRAPPEEKPPMCDQSGARRCS